MDAIRLIQKTDRGRQGRNRLSLIYKTFLANSLKTDLMEKRRLGLIPNVDPEQQELDSTIFVQRRMQGILARKYVEGLRNEEMEFLGMSRKKPLLVEGEKDPLEKQITTTFDRKNKQKTHFADYSDAKDTLMEDMDANEGLIMKEEMIKDRREWVNEYRKKNLGKIPEDLKEFHTRHEVPETPEDGEEGKDAKGKGDKKEKGKGEKKEKGKKGKKKKKGAGEDDAEAIKRIGPTEVVQKFDEFYTEFNDVWASRDESENYKQEHDEGIAKMEVKPLLEK